MLVKQSQVKCCFSFIQWTLEGDPLLGRKVPPILVLTWTFRVRYPIHWRIGIGITVRSDPRRVTIEMVGKMVGTQVAIIVPRLEVVIALHTAPLHRAHDDKLFV